MYVEFQGCMQSSSDILHYLFLLARSQRSTAGLVTFCLPLGHVSKGTLCPLGWLLCSLLMACAQAILLLLGILLAAVILCTSLEPKPLCP